LQQHGASVTQQRFPLISMSARCQSSENLNL
jgi:hypothetical protein